MEVYGVSRLKPIGLKEGNDVTPPQSLDSGE